MSLLSLLSGPLVSILEKELVAAEPVIANMLVKEVELLVVKLEALVAAKTKNSVPNS